MKHNVGTFDRIIRILIALVIFVLGYMNQSWWGLIGLIPLLTGLYGYCGLYSIIGISTCKVVPVPKKRTSKNAKKTNLPKS